MIKSLSSLFILGFSLSAFCCEIQLPGHLLILGDQPNLSNVFVHTECSAEAVQEVGSTLKSLEGKVASYQLSEILKAKSFDVKISPQMFQVQHIRNIVREQLMLSPGVQLKSSAAMNAQDYIVLNPGDKVEVQCSACLFGSQQPLNVQVRGFDGTNRLLTIKADFKKMVKAYRLTSFQPAFSSLSAHFLREEYIESIPHTDLVTNLDTLRFFKVNKPLRAGELLRQSDLNALSLVKAGVKTDVIIENSLIKLQTTGISRSNGSLGEFVEVFHPQKNKKYQGKVIDINKVLVEL